jgi:hypothetical protein
MANSPKLSGDKNTPEKEATGNVTGTTPLTNRNWHGIPASISAAVEHRSPSTRYIVDDEDTEDDGNSGDGKPLIISFFLSFITYLHPSLCCDYFIILKLIPNYIKFIVTRLAYLAVLFPNQLIIALLANGSPSSVSACFLSFSFALAFLFSLRLASVSFVKVIATGKILSLAFHLIHSHFKVLLLTFNQKMLP